MNYSRDRRPRDGFTLIEVLLVLVILVVLSSFAVMAYGPIQKRANINAAKSQVGLLKGAVRTYETMVGTVPTTAQGLQALRTQPPDLPNPAKWEGPYLDADLPMDPWGNPYQYSAPGLHNPDGFDIWSFGPDGVNGTEDDIGNWSQEPTR